MWIEAISPTCTPWSCQGSRHEWLDKMNLPLIFYAARLRDPLHLPKVLFLECTVGLDLRFIERLSMNNVRFSACKLGPAKVGMPICGDRLWAASAQAPFQFKKHPFNDAVLKQCVERTVSISPDQFMSASYEEIHSFHALLGGQRLQAHPRGKAFRWQDYFSPGTSARMLQHSLRLAKMRTDMGNHLSKFPAESVRDLMRKQVFDVSQNVTYASEPKGLIPRPLCSSMMFSESRQGLLLPRELWEAQGLSFQTIVSSDGSRRLVT